MGKGLLDDKLDRPIRDYPHFDSLVPKTIPENAQFRKDLLLESKNNEGFQQEEMKKCGEDSLYWLASYCMLYEPRPKPSVFAFLPWAHQIPAWKEIERWIGYSDIGMEKSRGEGASWMAMMMILHKWLYLPMFSAGVVSKDENTCDNPTNPDSLFWKLDWQIKQLPYWMVPQFKRSVSQHTLLNQENEASVAGFAATSTVGTGGRKTVFVMDELAKFPRGPDRHAMDSTQHVTDCRLLISTPFGPDGAYYDAMHHDSSIKKIILHWSLNPSRKSGLYRVKHEKLGRKRIELDDLGFWSEHLSQKKDREVGKGEAQEIADEVVAEDDKNPFGYKFMLAGEFVKHDKPRSPWYDGECRRPGATPRSIAQELDLDYGGSTSRFFDVAMIERKQASHTSAPKRKGTLLVPPYAEHYSHLKKVKFAPVETGDLWLWADLDVNNRPNGRQQCVIGCDLGAGTGGVKSSNSTAVVLNRSTGEQLAIIATPDMVPDKFADFVVALCYFFHGPTSPAMLIWEANGPPGMQFTKRISELEYNYIYLRGGAPEQVVEKTSRLMGWWSSSKTKPVLLGEFSRALDANDVLIRDTHTLEEAKFYMNLAGGKIEHISASHEVDPSGAGDRHGDRVIGAALAWWMAKEYRQAQEEDTPDASPHSFLGRRMKAKEELKTKKVWVPRSVRRHRVGALRMKGV